MSLGPALVCGLRETSLLLGSCEFPEREEAVLCEGSPLVPAVDEGGVTSRFRRERRGDFDFERMTFSDAFRMLLYFEKAAWRSEPFVETTRTSRSGSSMVSVPNTGEEMTT